MGLNKEEHINSKFFVKKMQDMVHIWSEAYFAIGNSILYKQCFLGFLGPEPKKGNLYNSSKAFLF